MRSTRSRLVVALVLSLAMLIGVSPAYADVNFMDPDYGVSATNPGHWDEYSTVWRETWGNSPKVLFDLKVPQPIPNEQKAILSAVYNISRADSLYAGAVITTDMALSSYHSDVQAMDLWNVTLDMPSEFAHPGPFLGSFPDTPTAVSGYEGLYVMNFRYHTSDSYVATGSINFGIDQTPPRQPTNVVLREGIGTTPLGSTALLRQGRVVLEWEDKVYDDLAGVAYFQVFKDGSAWMNETGEPHSRRVFDMEEHYPGMGLSTPTPRQITIEDMPAGRHVYQVQAVDRATNQGPLSDPVIITVDPDEPSLAWISPSVNGQWVGVRPSLEASASDLGGVDYVNFYVDGVYKATDSVKPYSYTADFSGAVQSSEHTVTATAYDEAGRSTSKSMVVRVDTTAPKITSLSDTPDPFYPRKRDGFRDNSYIKYKLSERSNVKLQIFTSSGALYRTLALGTQNAGSYTAIWDGKSNSGKVAAGTYKYKISATDLYGSTGTSSYGYTTIKTYQIVKVGSNGVKIIQR